MPSAATLRALAPSRRSARVSRAESANGWMRRFASIPISGRPGWRSADGTPTSRGRVHRAADVRRESPGRRRPVRAGAATGAGVEGRALRIRDPASRPRRGERRGAGAGNARHGRLDCRSSTPTTELFRNWCWRPSRTGRAGNPAAPADSHAHRDHHRRRGRSRAQRGHPCRRARGPGARMGGVRDPAGLFGSLPGGLRWGRGARRGRGSRDHPRGRHDPGDHQPGQPVLVPGHAAGRFGAHGGSFPAKSSTAFGRWGSTASSPSAATARSGSRATWRAGASTSSGCPRPSTTTWMRRWSPSASIPPSRPRPTPSTSFTPPPRRTSASWSWS